MYSVGWIVAVWIFISIFFFVPYNREPLHQEVYTGETSADSAFWQAMYLGQNDD